MEKIMMSAVVAATHHAATGGNHYTGTEVFYGFILAFSIFFFSAIVAIIARIVAEEKFDLEERDSVGLAGIIFVLTVIVSIFAFQYIMGGDFIWNTYGK